MARPSNLPWLQRVSVVFAGLCAWALIAYLTPSSRPRELTLLALLGLVALVPLSLLFYRYSNRMLRTLKMARREHALFKMAAEGSMKGFALCKPVCTRKRVVRDFRISYTNASAQRMLCAGRQTLARQSIGKVLRSAGGDSVFTTLLRVSETGGGERMLTHRLEGGLAAELLELDVESVGSCLALSLRRPNVEEVTPEKVHELQELAQSVIENAPISMIATDSSGMIVAMNTAAERLTLYSRHELTRQHSMTMLHDPLELRAANGEIAGNGSVLLTGGFEVLTRQAQSRQESQEWTYLRKDGSRACVSLTMVTLETPGKRVAGHLAIAFDITERKRLTDSVVHMARYDQLTGLGNRFLLREQLTHSLAKATQLGRTLAVFMVDLDYFKRVNDLLGHGAGDNVLAFIARQLNGALRQPGTVARVGGDEFIVLLPDAGTRAEAERCAQEMLAAISAPVTIAGREVQMTASIGVCLFPDDASTGDDMLRNADIAMHQSKSEGRGCVRCFSEEMQREAADRLEMEEDLRHALDLREFELHYQPQVDCRTGSVIGMEMLLRWRSPKRGNVPPNVFLPIAEQAGLMIGIGEWGLRQACLDCVRMQRELGRPLRVAVNFSPRQINQRNLTTIVKQALAESGLLPSHFEIEITEQILMMDTPSVQEALAELRQLGVKVAIDDFGTGFSSFSYILKYRVDRLKVDRSFVSQLNQDGHANAIVRAILSMGRGLHLEVVAEGVETREQLAFLTRKRCDSVQGFLFSKAVPIGQFVQTTRSIEEHAGEWIAALSSRPGSTLPRPALPESPRWMLPSTTSQVSAR